MGTGPGGEIAVTRSLKYSRPGPTSVWIMNRSIGAVLNSPAANCYCNWHEHKLKNVQVLAIGPGGQVLTAGTHSFHDYPKLWRVRNGEYHSWTSLMDGNHHWS